MSENTRAKSASSLRQIPPPLPGEENERRTRSPSAPQIQTDNRVHTVLKEVGAKVSRQLTSMRIALTTTPTTILPWQRQKESASMSDPEDHPGDNIYEDIGSSLKLSKSVSGSRSTSPIPLRKPPSKPLLSDYLVPADILPQNHPIHASETDESEKTESRRLSAPSPRFDFHTPLPTPPPDDGSRSTSPLLHSLPARTPSERLSTRTDTLSRSTTLSSSSAGQDNIFEQNYAEHPVTNRTSSGGSITEVSWSCAKNNYCLCKPWLFHSFPEDSSEYGRER